MSTERHKMNVVEIFTSIDGEGPNAGKLAQFIRLAGCNLKCNYCDSMYAHSFDVGEMLTAEEIVAKLDDRIDNVTLTGGEPLFNTANAYALMHELWLAGYNVSVETNGSVRLASYIDRWPEAQYIMDFKLPSSGMHSRMDLYNIALLRECDVIKFVVGSYADMEEMLSVLEYHPTKAQIYVSPVFENMRPEKIVMFMKEHLDNSIMTQVRLQVQLHKIVWSPEKRGV